jgi:hypothetical protein
MAAGILQPGQSNASTAGGGGNGSLAGNTYQGAFGNLANDVPLLGGLLQSLYGSKYGIPNPTSSAAAAIGGNIGNLGADTALTEGADATSALGAALPFEINLPGYESNLSQAATNTGEELQGEVPQDVQNLLAEQAAERGISTGQAPGSPDTNAAYLQALGLTSIGQEQQGQSNLSQLIGETPTGPAFNPSSMFVTPEQQQAAQLASNQEAAAPDPQAAGLLNTFMSFI